MAVFLISGGIALAIGRVGSGEAALVIGGLFAVLLHVLQQRRRN